MKILHVITGLGTGGAETMLLKLVAESAGRPEEHIVVSLMDEGMRGAAIKQYSRLYCLGLKPGKISFGALVRLSRIIRQEEPDIVQGWMYHANIAATFANAFCSSPLFWNIRHSLSDLSHEKGMTRLLIRLSGLLSNSPHKIVNNSQSSIAQHEALGFKKGRSVFIPNGFDLERFYPMTKDERNQERKTFNAYEDEVLIVNVARYHPMKNHVGMIRLVAKLMREKPELKCIFAGSKVDRSNEALISAAVETGFQERFVFVGELKDPRSLYSCGDITLLGSLWGEGFPNMIGESMACGTPCVVSDVGDSAFLLGSKEFVYSPSSEDEAFKTLRRAVMLAPEERRALGDAARERIQQHFSIESVYQQYMTLYQQALS